MTVRIALAVTAATALATLTACSAETSSEQEEVVQVEEGTVDTTACLIRGGCLGSTWQPPLVLDPGFPDFYCAGTGPHGGKLILKDGKCYEEIIVQNPCSGSYFTCPPSRFLSAYNPCGSTRPYYRCNVYGDCWCSAYP